MSFLDLLQPQGDKATLSESIFAKNHLPKTVQTRIPACLFDDDGGIDFEVLLVLAWVLARRENPDITKEQVGERIGVGHIEAVRPITKEITYFFTSESREDIEERYAALENVEEVEKPEENPMQE